MAPAPVPEDAAAAFAADLQRATSGDGVGFRERMTPAAGTGPRVTMRLNIGAPSLDRLVADPAHALRVEGALDIEGVVGAAVAAGSLSLFPDDGDEAMRYDLVFHDAAGSPWRLTGTKILTRRTPWTALRDLTHLTAFIAPVDGSVPAATVRLRIGVRDLTRMVTSIRGVGFTRIRRLTAAARFLAFFAGAVLRRQPAV